MADAPAASGPLRPPERLATAIRALSVIGVAMAGLALADLAVRAAVRLELRWDTFDYHLPFAARLGGLGVPYTFNPTIELLYQGFPLLPHLVEGILWRATGSMNATGVAGYLAFATFLIYGQRALRAPFWLVALIALTAPMVVIHTATSYVDLFGNACLAMGAAGCVYLYLFPDEDRPGTLSGALAGLAAAAWSKFQLVPLVGLLLVILAAVVLRRPYANGRARRAAIVSVAGVALIAAAPYLKNWIFYGNPFWPIRPPLIGDHVPWARDAVAQGLALQRPAALRDIGQFPLFVHSLFEIHHPTRYAWRPRWIIDQGNAHIAFRMGGFWGVAAAFYLIAVVATLVRTCGRRGAVTAAGAIAVLALNGCLPASNELRYYLYIPLAGAAIMGILFRRLCAMAPRAAAAGLVLVFALFLHMVFENRMHYRIERIGQAEAARAWGANAYWSDMQRGRTYCAVGLAPIPFLLTGPTLHEFAIVDCDEASQCPPVSEILRER